MATTSEVFQSFDPSIRIFEKTGVPIEQVRILVTFIAAFSSAIVYHWIFRVKHVKNTFLKHLFLTTFGFAFGMYNYGLGMFRTVATVLLTHIILQIFGGSRMSVFLVALVAFGHLLYGYILKVTQESYYDKLFLYDWTVPHCVLTLKLISVAIDLFDGQKKRTGKNINHEALTQAPSLAHLTTHSFFPGNCIFGPVSSIKFTILFVENDIKDSLFLNRIWFQVLKRTIIGLIYAFLFSTGGKILPPEFLLSPEFAQESFWYKILYLTISIRLQFYRYFFLFQVVEAICIMYGINFDVEKKKFSNICRNSDPKAFDVTGLSVLDTFNAAHNIRTNHWIAKYIFYRLPIVESPLETLNSIMNHKLTRFFITSLFTATWHGLYSGYFAFFCTLPFVYMMEWDFMDNLWPLIEKRFQVSSFSDFSPPTKLVLFILLRFYNMFALANFYTSLLFLTFEDYFRVFKSIHFSFHAFLITYWVVRIAANSYIPKVRNEEEKDR